MSGKSPSEERERAPASDRWTGTRWACWFSCDLELRTLAASGLTAIDDRRLSEDGGQERTTRATTTNTHAVLHFIDLPRSLGIIASSMRRISSCESSAEIGTRWAMRVW